MFTMRNYVQAESLEEAYALRRKNRKNVILGGNLWRKMGSATIMTGIDLCNLSLDQITETEEEYKIGCMCSLRDLEVNESLEQEFQGSLREALRHIVGVQFRNTATVGGSVFPRFGFSDVLTILAALDCEIELYHAGRVPIREFACQRPDDDILVNVIVKKDKRSVSYQSHRMTETDFGVLTCAVAYKDGTYTVALGARPYSAKAAEHLILNNPEDPEEMEAFLEQTVSQFTFGSNMRGSAEYRRAIAKVLIRRAVAQIHDR